MSSFLTRLKERKLVQWTLAYLAGAWVVLQVLDVVADPLGWPDSVQVAVFVLVAAGFFVTVTVAWHHGEKGRQRVTAGEVVAVAGILVLAVAALWWMDLTPGGRDRAGVDGANARPARSSPSGVPADPRPSVAVLPFDNRSQVTEDTFFTDGVHAQILGQISKISSLRVLSRTSVLEYRESPKSIRDIGAELGAEYVMEGGVQRAGERVLISTNLIRAADDESVWSGEFEYGLVVDSVFAVQRHVAQGVADALSAELVAGDAEQIESRPPESLDAWNAYVEGDLVGPTGDPARWRTQIEAFERATRLDPDFGLAWAGLTQAYAVGFSNAYWTDVAAIRAVLERAETLAPTAPETRIARATVRYYVDRDLPGAREAFAASLQDRPNDAYAWLLKGAVERRMDLWEEAARSFEQAEALEPREELTKGMLSVAYLMLGRVAEAERMANQRAALSGYFGNLADITLSLRGDTAAARALAQRFGAPINVSTVDLSLPYLRRDFDAALDEWLDFVPWSDPRAAVRLGWIAELAERTGRTGMARSYADSLMSLAEPKVVGGGTDGGGLQVLFVPLASTPGPRALPPRRHGPCRRARRAGPGRVRTSRGPPGPAPHRVHRGPGVPHGRRAREGARHPGGPSRGGSDLPGAPTARRGLRPGPGSPPLPTAAGAIPAGVAGQRPMDGWIRLTHTVILAHRPHPDPHSPPTSRDGAHDAAPPGPWAPVFPLRGLTMSRNIPPLAITLLLLGALLLPATVVAQVNAITEIRIPRQHSAEFIELYAEMAEMLDAQTEEARPTAKNLLGHAWANDVSFLQIITYESLDDLNADFNTDGAKMRAYRETLSEADREAFQERWVRFRGLYLEGHTDEVRVAVQDWGFNYDPAGHEDHAHVVTRSQYWTTYANAGEFLELTEKNLILEDPADHQALMVVASRHTSGSGPNVDVWSVYESWADFAEFMTDTSRSVDEADLARAFEIEGKHRDDIFMRVGTLARDADGTGRFVVAGN